MTIISCDNSYLPKSNGMHGLHINKFSLKFIQSCNWTVIKLQIETDSLFSIYHQNGPNDNKKSMSRSY